MPRECLSLSPHGASPMRRPVDSLNPQALLDAALGHIEPDGSVAFDKNTPGEYRQLPYKPAPSDKWDDWTWAYKALDIATILYRNLSSTPEPEYALSSLAHYLTAYQHDPALLRAAISLIGFDGETPSPPQNATVRLQWREEVARLRLR